MVTREEQVKFLLAVVSRLQPMFEQFFSSTTVIRVEAVMINLYYRMEEEENRYYGILYSDCAGEHPSVIFWYQTTTADEEGKYEILDPRDMIPRILNDDEFIGAHDLGLYPGGGLRFITVRGKGWRSSEFIRLTINGQPTWCHVVAIP